MYSVVLMAALTAGGETPECHRNNGCNGCYGGGYASCNGGGCHGGGGLFGGRHGCHGGGGLFGGRHGCNGGGCFGGGHGGCFGGGHGGCWGGGHGGCYGGGHGGCYGGAPVYHGGCNGTVVVPGPGPGPKPGPGPGPGPKPDPNPKGGKVIAPATIVVNLPADAKLFVDGTATTSTSGTRILVTPALPAGQQFTYNLKAETIVNGQTVVQEQQVQVQGGEQTPVSFTFATQAVSTSAK